MPLSKTLRPLLSAYTCADPEGRTGGPDLPLPQKSKNIGFLSNIGPDPL